MWSRYLNVTDRQRDGQTDDMQSYKHRAVKITKNLSIVCIVCSSEGPDNAPKCAFRAQKFKKEFMGTAPSWEPCPMWRWIGIPLPKLHTVSRRLYFQPRRTEVLICPFWLQYSHTSASLGHTRCMENWKLCPLTGSTSIKCRATGLDRNNWTATTAVTAGWYLGPDLGWSNYSPGLSNEYSSG